MMIGRTELAKRVGLSPWTILRYTQAGKIPAVRTGTGRTNKILYDYDEVIKSMPTYKTKKKK